MSRSWVEKSGCPNCGKNCAQATFNTRMWFCHRVGKTVFDKKMDSGIKGNNQMSLGGGLEGGKLSTERVTPRKGKQSGQLLFNFPETPNGSNYDFEV